MPWISPTTDLFLHSTKTKDMNRYRKDQALLHEARTHWENLTSYRQRRDRCKRYCYGDQWGDPVMVDGKWMREEHYIRSHGSEPLKNNLIRRMVKQVLGLYRSRQHPVRVPDDNKAEARRLTQLLRNVQTYNSMAEVNARALEEFLISGMVVQRKSYGWRRGHAGCWTDNVPANLFFIDSWAVDCRGWDVDCIGEIHDLRFDELCEQFARGTDDMEALHDIYAPATYLGRVREMLSDFGSPTPLTEGFLCPTSPHLCRVYEVWRMERRQGFLCHDREAGELVWVSPADSNKAARYDSRQWTTASEWHYYYITPFGDVLDEGVTPYTHRSHPYVMKAYPYIDGEIHSFVGDIIDQQRYTNRLITLYDWVMRSSAKGVLLVPEECIAEGYTMEDIADQWARFNGVIPIRTCGGAMMPQQVAANAVNIGINELLQTQLNFMEDISGITGALQGKKASAGVSGTLYEQQTHNATLSQLDLLDTFNTFLDEGEKIDVSNIRQFF